MAKAAKKKAKAAKKSARVAAKPKAAAKSVAASKKKAAKPAAKKAAKPAAATVRKAAPAKIDPLNRKGYRAVTPMLSVSDMRSAMNFYTTALGFTVKQVMDSPQGPVHAELTFRDTTLMLGPESHEQGSLSAKSIGNTPVTLYMLVESVDDLFASAVAAGGTVLMPVMDMFWGDRCGVIGDPEGNKWMIATHKSEPTEKEMAEAMRQMQASAGGESEY
jgi:PhnB protein